MNKIYLTPWTQIRSFMYIRNNIQRVISDVILDNSSLAIAAQCDVVICKTISGNKWRSIKNRYGSNITIFDGSDDLHEMMECVDKELEKEEYIVLLNSQEQVDRLMVLI